MDVVILAAGRNERLKGLVPAYMKPLLIVNGRPLIVDIMMKIMQYTAVTSVTVVVAPDNAKQVCELLAHSFDDDSYNVVVQPEAQGPTDAVRRALPLGRHHRVMIVCGDNVVPTDDMREVVYVAAKESNGVMTVSRMYGEAAMRFTRVSTDPWMLIESQDGGKKADGTYDCWIGPVSVKRDKLEAVIEGSSRLMRLSAALEACGPLQLHLGNSQDIGVPEELVNGNAGVTK